MGVDITMRFILPILLLVISQSALAQPTVQIDPVQVAPQDEAAMGQRAVRRLLGVVRVCFERGGEGYGAGRIVLRAAFARGRVTNMTLVSTNGAPNADAVTCTQRALRARIRAPEDSPMTELVIPIRFEYPELALPANAMDEARAARRRGRCLLDAANELTAAIRAFERSRGRARARAHARVEAARAALSTCELGLLQGAEGVGTGTGIGIGTDTCPHCRDSSTSTDADEGS